MWGLFAGEARKQPPHIPFSTAIPKDPKNYFQRFAITKVKCFAARKETCREAPFVLDWQLHRPLQHG